MTRVVAETALRQMLICHPGAPCPRARRIAVSLSRQANGLLVLNFALEGDLAGLQLPSASPRRRVDGLWRHTCFEAFVGAAGKPEYCEFNFSPSGEWAAYAFSSYRERVPLEAAAPVSESHVSATGSALTLAVTLHLGDLPGITASTLLRVGMSAVLEEQDGQLSYWALRHPQGAPDFHHADAFALQLDPLQ